MFYRFKNTREVLNRFFEQEGKNSQRNAGWFNFCRDVCTFKNRRDPQVIGGVGHIVQIDETVVSRAKYGRGRYAPPRWVFGGYDLTTKKGFLQHVPDRSAETLLPIIQEHILPGTEIHSEMWRAYRQISRLPVAPRYRHLAVNHSRNFVDPVTHVCTNGIENMWMCAKKKIRAANGSRAELTPGYLEELLWHQKYGRDGQEAFESILRDIATFGKSSVHK